MAKSDNPYIALMINRIVNLKCDDEKLQCRYLAVQGKTYGTWWINGENTGLQVTELWKKLKEKYRNIEVLYKRM